MKRLSRKNLADSTFADLHEWNRDGGPLLPNLLFCRDHDAIVRWCKVRTWIDNAVAAEPSQELKTIDLAAAYLVESAADAPEPPLGEPPSLD